MYSALLHLWQDGIWFLGDFNMLTIAPSTLTSKHHVQAIFQATANVNISNFILIGGKNVRHLSSPGCLNL
jgi:hypothetical protein